MADVDALHRWQLREDAAELYEQIVVPRLRPWAQDLVDLSPIRSGDRILDVACGTGVVARTAARRIGSNGSVVGLDVNASMINAARSVSDEMKIDWVQADIAEPGLPHASFDVVLCQQGLQYFDDALKALQCIYRLLRRGGTALLSVWAGPSAYHSALCDAVARYIGAAAAASLRRARPSANAELLKSLLSQAGFRDVSVVPRTRESWLPPPAQYVLRHLAASPLAAAAGALTEQAQTALVEDVASALASYAVPEGILFSETVNVAVGRR